MIVKRQYVIYPQYDEIEIIKIKVERGETLLIGQQTLEEFINYLVELNNLYENCRIEEDSYHDCETNVILIYHEYETDDEYHNRITLEKLRKQQLKDIKKADFKRIKNQLNKLDKNEINQLLSKFNRGKK